ncbi:hydantoinase/oxoprolinase family protein [Thalassoroseus pseudoceratinae]|uniref:hydantoinase/oxoprolinase family protein n=1 Tax=Thalassoroseus pseudoceratinae TaxID=2713176 RepID=UPI00141E9D9D|nr:hydantoinase/oxoprolinase family protein [Thalassoroseus pseudoceratinae]
MRTLGLDIGGANIKAADVDGMARSMAFPLWEQPDRLSEVLRDFIAEFPPPDRFAVTMTGELADCFRTKADGVDSILAAVEQVANDRPIVVWQTGAEFVSPEVAREIPLLVAAANWHALATWVGRILPADSFAILLDVGSTTTDVIPLTNGVPTPTGLTDTERLCSGELVYTGVHRTPIVALANEVPWRDGHCSLAAELFATTQDVYLLTGELPEEPTNSDTANNRPATREAACDRLARMLCADTTEVAEEEITSLAHDLSAIQIRRILSSIDQVLATQASVPTHVLTSGSGSFLAERVTQTHPQLRTCEHVDLARMFADRISEAACAFAVARLAVERDV